MNDYQIKWIALIFVFLATLFESFTLNLNFSDFLIYSFDNQTLPFFLIILICILASLFLFFRFIYFSLSSNWYYKIFCLLTFILVTFLEYAYQKALGRFVDVFDVESAFATTTEQQIGSINLYLNMLAVVPCLALLLLMVFVKSKESFGNLKPLLVNILLFVLYFGGSSYFAKALSDQRIPSSSFSAFCQTTGDFLIWGPLSNGKWAGGLTGIRLERRAVKAPNLAADFRPSNNIVLVLDESVRGDHLSINGYVRKTTPFLEELSKRGLLKNWGIAAAASTGSRFTYNALVTGLTPDDLPDFSEFKVNTSPTIFQYAKAMRYKTYFIDGQMKVFWSGIVDDRKYVDEWLSIESLTEEKKLEKWEIDHDIARRVNLIVSSSPGNFIVIFKHGSHIPYQENFPPAGEVWQPSYTTGNKFVIPDASRFNEVVNAYDNSLRYNIDAFFKNLVDDYSRIPNNTVILYTGDHGQTLFANGKASHGGNTKEEAMVPLFIVGDLNEPVDTGFLASHKNIYPTLLDLMGYPDELRERRYVISLLKARASDSKPRFFNPDLGKKIPFD